MYGRKAIGALGFTTGVSPRLRMAGPEYSVWATRAIAQPKNNVLRIKSKEGLRNGCNTPLLRGGASAVKLTLDSLLDHNPAVLPACTSTVRKELKSGNLTCRHGVRDDQEGSGR